MSPLLQTLRLHGVNYQRCLLRSPWSVAFGPQGLPRFHYVSGGNIRLWTASMGSVSLAKGDAVLLPRGGFHIVASAADFPPAEIERLRATVLADDMQLVNGMEGNPHAEPTDAMFCGTFRFEMDPLHPLLQLMPEVLVLSDLARQEPNVPDLLQAMQREVQRAAAGSEAIQARLADALAALMVRAWVLSAPADTRGLVSALRCPRVGKVLAAIHRDPGARWTVPQLASVMGASRSTFTEAFTRTVGESPARYVAQVRMAQASRWIGEQGVRVSSAAYRLGYESEAAFSRAFKRVMGKAPGRARQLKPLE
ncbi:AraC family transcriptional regulator [Variovorax sp. RA8]|uniref:AraC family transcriptional regulator n=1 Tax=Variovorax sp. (strain JCM 16519 / RA8) TaxID=662548 RepID=UPI001318DC08|nr:AraC family transcriptional regulator [Variovorax sp. RA8]VTU16658.1 Bacillibactin transport regulator [Variovorax sp. RA8]